MRFLENANIVTNNKYCPIDISKRTAFAKRSTHMELHQKSLKNEEKKITRYGTVQYGLSTKWDGMTPAQPRTTLVTIFHKQLSECSDLEGSS